MNQYENINKMRDSEHHMQCFASNIAICFNLQGRNYEQMKMRRFFACSTKLYYGKTYVRYAKLKNRGFFI